MKSKKITLTIMFFISIVNCVITKAQIDCSILPELRKPQCAVQCHAGNCLSRELCENPNCLQGIVCCHEISERAFVNGTRGFSAQAAQHINLNTIITEIGAHSCLTHKVQICTNHGNTGNNTDIDIDIVEVQDKSLIHYSIPFFQGLRQLNAQNVRLYKGISTREENYRFNDVFVRATFVISPGVTIDKYYDLSDSEGNK